MISVDKYLSNRREMKCGLTDIRTTDGWIDTQMDERMNSHTEGQRQT